MDQAYLISLVEGFYPFGKRSKTQTQPQQALARSGDVDQHAAGATVKAAVVATNTGVGRYLSARPVESGVARYLKKSGAQPMSTVGKYLVAQSIKDRAVIRVTGVSKYLARFDSETAASGVAKYVAKQIIKTKYLPKRTTVGRYVTRQEIAAAKLAALTGVAKYQAEQDLLQRKIDAQKLIERYREEEARLAAEKAAALQARSQAEPEAMQAAVIDEVPAETRVGRYLQQKLQTDSQKPAVSKVAKYIAQQIVRDSLKPRQSGVARYLAKSRVYTAKPVVSGVANYLEAQARLAKTRPAFSGVAKYLIKQRLALPSQPVKTSGVAKYLAQHTQAVSDISEKESVKREFVLTGVAEYLKWRHDACAAALAQAGVPVEICLEGEFIPAEEALETGNTKPKKAKATRVSKYINEHQPTAKNEASSKTPTGVDKYLLQSA